jgi:phosphoribosylaminoimidazole-succinocarboxamide synthase
MPALEAPEQNFSRGIRQVDLPSEFGPRHEGKVRDCWVIDTPAGKKRVLVTTGRTSAMDHLIGAVPKAAALNLMSAHWFENTADIAPNHMEAVPHQNVMVAQEAAIEPQVELVYRGYLAKSPTKTSIYYNYFVLGRRDMYGMHFPDNLLPNQPFPPELGKNGVILTPTTKASQGHDEELTEDAAREIVDKAYGSGIWDQMAESGYQMFDRVSEGYRRGGLIFVDTKWEPSIDINGQLMYCDEHSTSDSSRLWLAKTYLPRLEEGLEPEMYDKQILRNHLQTQGFTGEEGQEIPIVPGEVWHQMAIAYREPFRRVTGRELPQEETDPNNIARAIVEYFDRAS